MPLEPAGQSLAPRSDEDDDPISAIELLGVAAGAKREEPDGKGMGRRHPRRDPGSGGGQPHELSCSDRYCRVFCVEAPS